MYIVPLHYEFHCCPDDAGTVSGSSEQQQQAEAVRSLLEEKKAGLSRSRLEELERAQVEVEARERKQLEREQRRAARLKADRKAAIEELKKRREEKRILQERLAQEEVVSKEVTRGGRTSSRFADSANYLPLTIFEGAISEGVSEHFQRTLP